MRFIFQFFFLLFLTFSSVYSANPGGVEPQGGTPAAASGAAVPNPDPPAADAPPPANGLWGCLQRCLQFMGCRRRNAVGPQEAAAEEGEVAAAAADPAEHVVMPGCCSRVRSALSCSRATCTRFREGVRKTGLVVSVLLIPAAYSLSSFAINDVRTIIDAINDERVLGCCNRGVECSTYYNSATRSSTRSCRDVWVCWYAGGILHHSHCKKYAHGVSGYITSLLFAGAAVNALCAHRPDSWVTSGEKGMSRFLLLVAAGTGVLIHGCIEGFMPEGPMCPPYEINPDHLLPGPGTRPAWSIPAYEGEGGCA